MPTDRPHQQLSISICGLTAPQSLKIYKLSNQNVLQTGKVNNKKSCDILISVSVVGAHLGRNRLWVRFLAVSNVYIMFIEPTIKWVPSGFSGYIWLDIKIVLKILLIIKFGDPTSFLHIRPIPHTQARELTQIFVGSIYSLYFIVWSMPSALDLVYMYSTRYNRF